MALHPNAPCGRHSWHGRPARDPARLVDTSEDRPALRDLRPFANRPGFIRAETGAATEPRLCPLPWGEGVPQRRDG